MVLSLRVTILAGVSSYPYLTHFLKLVIYEILMNKVSLIRFPVDEIVGQCGQCSALILISDQGLQTIWLTKEYKIVESVRTQ